MKKVVVEYFELIQVVFMTGLAKFTCFVSNNNTVHLASCDFCVNLQATLIA